MSVANFLRQPKRFRLRIGEDIYVIRKALHETGDNPGFESYLLEMNSDPAIYLVAKLIHFPKELNGENIKTQQEQLETIKRRIETKRIAAQRLEKFTEVTKSVPEIKKKSVHCISELGEEHEVTDYLIVREFIKGMILSNWMEAYEHSQGRPAKRFVGIREPSIWFQLARNLVQALTPIHSERLVHGDLRPRNIILEGLPAVDWGMRPDGLKNLNPEALDITNAKVRLLDTEEDTPDWFDSSNIGETGTFRRRYDSPKLLFEKVEKEGKFVARKSNAQWFAPTDIFSLGVILFTLACGDEARLGPFLSETLVEGSVQAGADCPTWFKVGSYEATNSNRQLKTALLCAWEDSLSERLGGIEKVQITRAQWTEGKRAILRMAEVILACLRSHTDPSVADLKAIEAIIEEFDPKPRGHMPIEETPTRRNSDPSSSKDPRSLEQALMSFIFNQSDQVPDLVKQLIYRRGQRLIGPLFDLVNSNGRHWSLRMTGRPTMVDTMVNLIGALKPADKCEALLTANFFSKENMGLVGRVTSALQLAAIRLVKFKWLILIKEEQLKDREVAEILQSQRSAEQFLFGLDESVVYGLSYVVVSQCQYQQVLQNRLTSISITTEPGNTQILVAPDYHGEGGQISALRVWARPDPDRWAEISKAFTQYDKQKLGLRAFYR